MIQGTMHRAGCNSGCICTRQTVKKPRRAREGRSPFELSIVPGGMYGGHGTVFASENPIFQRKKRFLAGSAPEKSSIFSGDWRGWQWRGSKLPRPPACQNFFDKLAGAFAPERLQGNYGSVQMSRRSKRPNARCFLALPKRKGGWSSHPQLCMPFISFYTCDLPPIFSFSHSTVSRIVLLSGLGV